MSVTRSRCYPRRRGRCCLPGVELGHLFTRDFGNLRVGVPGCVLNRLQPSVCAASDTECIANDVQGSRTAGPPRFGPRGDQSVIGDGSPETITGKLTLFSFWPFQFLQPPAKC